MPWQKFIILVNVFLDGYFKLWPTANSISQTLGQRL